MSMLPKIDSPTMTMTMPSTGKKVQYKQFTVKEQKAILQASESEDEETMINTLIDLLNNCFNYDFGNAPLYDLEYAFTKLRVSSVGALTEIKLTCDKCSELTKLEVNLDDAYVDSIKKKDRVVEINKKQSLVLKSIEAKDSLILISKDEVTSNDLFDLIPKSIEIIINDEDTIKVKHDQELIDWCDGLPDTTVKHIIDFIKNTPRTKIKTQYKCSSCGHDHDKVIEGLSNFLS